jgi:hypothetical protein
MKMGASKTRHVHLFTPHREDPVTVTRTEAGYVWEIRPSDGSAPVISVSYYRTERQAWSNVQHFIRENWRPIAA